MFSKERNTEKLIMIFSVISFRYLKLKLSENNSGEVSDSETGEDSGSGAESDKERSEEENTSFARTFSRSLVQRLWLKASVRPNMFQF